MRDWGRGNGDDGRNERRFVMHYKPSGLDVGNIV